MPKIRIANPQPGSAKYTTASQADRYVRRGEAVLIGKTLHFLTDAEQRHQRNIERHISAGESRSRSDVYVDRRGTIWWNGARSVFVDGRDVAMFPPFRNVCYPRAWSPAALRRWD